MEGSEIIFVACPNRHNIPTNRAQGAIPGPFNQEFICPTCLCRFQAIVPSALTPVSISVQRAAREAAEMGKQSL